MQDLVPQPRIEPRPPCIGSVESYQLDHQGSSWMAFSLWQFFPTPDAIPFWVLYFLSHDIFGFSTVAGGNKTIPVLLWAPGTIPTNNFRWFFCCPWVVSSHVYAGKTHLKNSARPSANLCILSLWSSFLSGTLPWEFHQAGPLTLNSISSTQWPH